MDQLPEYGSKDTLYIIDLSGFVHRFFHVGPSWAGRNFAEMLKKLLERRGPSHVAIAEDLPFPTFRHELTQTYKATRADRPVAEKVAVLEQLRIAGELADDVYGVKRLAAKGFEADDVIATVTAQAVEEGLQVVIMALDKDMMQLIGTYACMWDGKDKVTGAAGVMEKFGVTPRQVVDYLSMVGDSSDNVPGVWGCGPVAAVKVLKTFGTLDAALSSAEVGRDDNEFWKANPKVWSRIAGARPAVEAARRLVRLRTDVPLVFAMDELRVVL